MFGSWLRRRRIERGLSLEELARRVGVTRRTVYRWEKEDVPYPHRARRIAEALEVELDEVLAAMGVDLSKEVEHV